MTLRSLDDATEFELRILGYQFPEITDCNWDSNWLMVKVSVRTPEASWSSTDPCMLTWESHWLLNWLADAASGAEFEPDMMFLECNLKFDVERKPNCLELRIRFQETLRPPTALDVEEFEILFDVSLSAVREAVDALCQ